LLVFATGTYHQHQCKQKCHQADSFIQDLAPAPLFFTYNKSISLYTSFVNSFFNGKDLSHIIAGKVLFTISLYYILIIYFISFRFIFFQKITNFIFL
jgi:hypothetical protein